MAEYNFQEIEKSWQQRWQDTKIYQTEIDHDKPKFYSLDMFPYPSGAGLHVGHPLGYIASDIVSRYKRMKGYNVLHPMGFDAFGLPAEQYAIQTGQHPAVTTEQNINRYKEQLRNIGFSYDWSREFATSDPDYYKWTQWIFKQLFLHYYDYEQEKARPISELTRRFEKDGNAGINACCDEETPQFSANAWKTMDEAEREQILLHYRLAYLSDTTVNWCPALGTVLANEEVKDGVSERGGFPVVRKKMRQWSLRITAYAERLLNDLEFIQWPEAVKEMQRNWIGRSEGAELYFETDDEFREKIKVFTTRIDTIFGVTFLVLAPEHELVEIITTPEQEAAVKEYVETAKNRSERDRMSDVKTVSGVFTGAYAINPFNGERIPIWIADYVLAGYGTGAVMAVPAHDTRDWAFAKHYNLPLRQVVSGGAIEKEAHPAKEGTIINSDFLNDLPVAEAMRTAVRWLERKEIGKGRTNYRMRDAIFSRQRYWGEPFPVYYKDGIPQLLENDELPLRLPEVDAYLPTESGEPPLARARNWKTRSGHPLETNTMPGWAGSSWYFFRYMDPKNQQEFVSKEAQEYWQAVDLYIGGAEHATGHLLYARFWTKFLYDINKVSVMEPFRKMINQGMIQGRSSFVYRLNNKPNTFVSFNIKDNYDVTPLHVEISLVENDVLDLEAFRKWRPDLANAEFILEESGPQKGKYICGSEVEKMSKRWHNVVNPDDVVKEYGADTLRLYEMFLGPLEQFKPWSTQGIDGVYKFLRKLWRLFHDEAGNFAVSDEAATKEELKVLHTAIKKATEDIDRYSFNTSVPAFMICVNELSALKCNKRVVLEKLVLIVAPYAPHIAEELWHLLGNQTSVVVASYPDFNEEFLQEDSFEYPISINGKMRAKMVFAVDTPQQDIEREVLASEQVQKWTEGKAPKKIIIVPKRIINIVV
ncbi:leucine--tRNA ligase [Cesiribacter sp. SM1]|uniref:leucine--tRNA ligase n=1 Tax=Cesiribacter sp. SM1 TaxID=2861196 RepID=UPI001CD2A03B|nr:leucine--tRNA ligase [Cesiribacter sp. SM1]